jgi:hypothetical protein
VSLPVLHPSIIPLFSTPIFHSSIGGIGDEVTGRIKHLKFIQDIAGEEGLLDSMPGFKNSIVTKVNEYLFKILELSFFDYYFPDSWFLRLNPSGRSIPHIHSNALYSGVVYIDASDNSNIVFNRSHYGGNLNSMVYDIEKKEENIYTTSRWQITPKNGDILIFPSFVSHAVSQNISGKSRVSFSFNILPLHYKSKRLGAKIY